MILGMAVTALIEAADYKNFKMLCAYTNQARHYLFLLRRELGEIMNVEYKPINWFDRISLNLYAKDPAKGSQDPVLQNLTVPDFPGRRAFSTNWSKDTFSRLKYAKDGFCKRTKNKTSRKGGGLLNAVIKVVGLAATAAYAVDRVAFISIGLVFNAYRWYLLEYMRKCKIRSEPCIFHDFIMTTTLRTSGKLFRGKGAFETLNDPRIGAVRLARPFFPPFQDYLQEVDQLGKKSRANATQRRRRV